MVKLEKMTLTDFDDYISKAIDQYANEKVEAGAWARTDARKQSEEALSTLLPNGVQTEMQYLFSIVDIEKQIKVGYLWFQCIEQLRAKEAFIYDFIIFEEYRDKGYGTQALYALNAEARKLEIEKIVLHVFAHNQKAVALYEKVGYRITDLHMTINL